MERAQPTDGTLPGRCPAVLPIESIPLLRVLCKGGHMSIMAGGLPQTSDGARPRYPHPRVRQYARIRVRASSLVLADSRASSQIHMGHGSPDSERSPRGGGEWWGSGRSNGAQRTTAQPNGTVNPNGTASSLSLPQRSFDWSVSVPLRIPALSLADSASFNTDRTHVL